MTIRKVAPIDDINPSVQSSLFPLFPSPGLLHLSLCFNTSNSIPIFLFKPTDDQRQNYFIKSTNRANINSRQYPYIYIHEFHYTIMYIHNKIQYILQLNTVMRHVSYLKILFSQFKSRIFVASSKEK